MRRTASPSLLAVSLRGSLRGSLRVSFTVLFAVMFGGLLALPLAGCGDGSDDSNGSAATATRGGDGTTGTDNTGRVAPPRAVATPKLPNAPALTDDAAESVLHSVLGSIEPDQASRDTLLYLVALDDKAALDAVRAQLLAKSDGEYDDTSAAALGLELLLAAGEQDAASETIDLARLLIDDDEEIPGIAWALSRIEGTQQRAAEELLARMTLSFDDEVSMLALEALAKRRSPAAAEHLGDIAGDADNSDMVRATAVAAMLMTNDERGAQAADSMVTSDAVGWEVVDGFAIHGATDAVPYIKRVMEQALADGNAEFEFTSACNALLEIYGNGPGAASGRALIEGWLEVDPDLDPETATYVLWALGDDSRTAEAAALLASEVAFATGGDGEMAVALLDEVARRGLARDPRFKKAVDAAAAMEDRKGLPGLDLTTQSLRAAGAHAYLRSR